ncbi:hypothetical protein ACFY3U_26380 [Micromonospora sp. NPDC000089]|uniref:hypothetical protein n=1 Tax=unclassified Micromonospora TaxID=2617518 RepID=UPI0036CADC2F
MRSAVLHAPRDVRVEEVDQPRILAPTDAIVLERAAEAYRAMDERRAIKALLRP